ncbi:MAG: hypothetical protein AB9856_13020 [Cellulosilyticaceae bacterium]
MKKYIIVMLFSVMGLVGCTTDLDKVVYSESGIVLEEGTINTNKKRTDMFIKNNDDMKCLQELEINREVSSISSDTDYNIIQIRNYDNSENEKKIVKFLESKLAPGIEKFVADARNTDKEKEKHFKSTVINNIGITVEGNHDKSLIITTNAVKPIDPRHLQILEDISKDGFVVLGPYVGEDTEVIEISTPAYINGSSTDYIYFEGEACMEIKDINNISYQLYIQNGDVNKVRMIINKGENEVIDENYLEPLFEIAKIMGIEDQSKIDELIGKIQNKDNQNEKGKMQQYEYQLKTINSHLNGNDTIFTNNTIELVLSK